MRDDAKAAVAQAKLDLDRAKALRAQDVIAQSEYDALKARYDALVGAAVAADARVGQARITLSDTELRSSLEGIVLHRAVEIGDLVSPGTPAFVVADTSKVKIVFGVPDSVQKGLRTGQAVAIHTEALPGRAFAGFVSKIAAKADDKSRAFDVEATVDNRDQALKVGFIATAELESTSAAAAGVVVPLSAIVPVPGRKEAFAVFVVQTKDDGSVATLRPVVLGDLVRNDVAVVDGVAEGESVIVDGANVVRDGEKVAVFQ
jgi:RND family efflux transporter MFP subunit